MAFGGLECGQLTLSVCVFPLPQPTQTTCGVQGNHFGTTDVKDNPWLELSAQEMNDIAEYMVNDSSLHLTATDVATLTDNYIHNILLAPVDKNEVRTSVVKPQQMRGPGCQVKR